MQKISVPIVMVLLVFLFYFNVNAEDIVNTGGDKTGGWVISDRQWVATEFTIAESYSLTDIEGLIYTWVSGTLDIAIYGDGGETPDTENELYHSNVELPVSNSAEWYGLSNLDWNLDAGTYWTAFEAREGPLQASITSNAPNPLMNEAVSKGTQSYIENDSLNFSFKIQGTPLEPIPEPEPTTYGLFVGTNYYWDDIAKLWKKSDLKGGETVEMVRDSFLNIPGIDIENTTLISELSVSDKQIEEAIIEIKDKMKPGDKFIFYLDGHGGTESDDGGETTLDGQSQGDEYVVTGWNFLDGSWKLTDDELYTYLNILGDDVEKWVFVDACHSGGFWGNGVCSEFCVSFDS